MKKENKYERRLRKRLGKKTFGDYVISFIAHFFYYIIIVPIIMIVKCFIWLWNFLFCETIKTSEKIGFGPAFGSTYERKFSFGKTAFVILIVFILIIIISKI